MAMFDQYLSQRYRTEARPSSEAYLVKDRTAIVGIGVTEFSKESGRSTLQLACEAIKTAVEDAGLRIEDIDGIVKYTLEATDENTLMSSLGIPTLNFFADCPYGGGACIPTVMHAAIAVATGLAKYVVCYRSLNEFSGRRYGRIGSERVGLSARNFQDGFLAPYGLMSPVSWVAMLARRYMYEYGATREHLGWVSIVCRENAQLNRRAMFFGRPIAMKDYLEARMIVEPFCLLDCCPDTDGAVAVIVTSAERARDLKQRPAYILAATQATATDGETVTCYHRPRISRGPESWYASQELWRVSGVTPNDIDVCQFYDAFSVMPIIQLEEYGFCGEGEGADFCWGGDRIRVGGDLPLNTAGGLLSEGYLHGMNLIVEAVRQIRGTSTNQVNNVELSMSTAGVGVPTGALILRR